MAPLHIGGTMSRFLMSIAKYAFDSTIRDALEVATGRKQVHKIVKEGLKDQPQSSSLYDCKPEDLNLMIEEIQAKMEKSKGLTNHMNQRHNASVTTVKGSKISKQLPNEEINGSDQTKSNQKIVFIRSRL